jgi:predicted Zn-dependent protease
MVYDPEHGNQCQSGYAGKDCWPPSRLPRRKRRSNIVKTNNALRSHTVLLLLSCSLALSSCVTPQGGQRLNVLSTKDEIALGDKIAAEVEKNEKVLGDAAIQAYVGEIGARLARMSPRQDVTYKFTVIDNPETVNAFALPGGHMYIYTGLMKLCENEAQLASVMAHEIGHVAEHHHGESMTRQMGYEFLLSLILGDSSSTGAEVGAQLLAAWNESRYSRTQENESDRVGMDLLWRAGYKPEAMVTFMENMLRNEQQQGRARPAVKFLSSHPATSERIAQLKFLVQQYPADLRATSPVYAERYKANVLDRLK